MGLVASLAALEAEMLNRLLSQMPTFPEIPSDPVVTQNGQPDAQRAFSSSNQSASCSVASVYLTAKDRCSLLWIQVGPRPGILRTVTATGGHLGSADKWRVIDTSHTVEWVQLY